MGLGLDGRHGDLGLAGDDERPARLYDPGLLPGDPLQIRAQELCVVEVDRCDGRDGAGRYDVGGVIASPQPYLQYDQVRRRLGEGHEGRRRCDLEEGDLLAGVGPLHPRQHLGQVLVGDQLPGQPDPLHEPDQMGRGVDVHLQPRGLGHGAREGHRGALAVGPGHVDHRRQAVLRPAHRVQHALDPLQRQINLLGMQRLQALQGRI